MKLKEYLLLESYFPGYYHLSNSKNITKNNLKLSKEDFKFGGKYHGGFWIAKGLSWYNFLQKNPGLLGRKPIDYIYRVKLKQNAKIMPFEKTSKDKYAPELLPKSKQHRVNSSLGKEWKDPNWDKLKKEYQGVSYLNIGKSIIYSGIDIPSIVIWDKDAIESIELLGDTEEVLKLNYINRKQKQAKRDK